MAVLLSTPPEEPILHRLEYETQVLRAYNGFEQRIANRSAPRWRLQYNVRMQTFDEFKQLKGDLVRRGGETWQLPIWWDWYETTTDETAASTSLSGSFNLFNIGAGDNIYVIPAPGGGVPYTKQVSSKNDTTINTLGTLGQITPAGSRVFFLADCALSGDVSLGRTPRNSLDVRIVADLLAPRTPPSTGGTDHTPLTHNSLDVIFRRPDNPGTAPEEYLQYFTRFDGGARFSQFQTTNYSDIAYPRTWSVVDRVDREKFYQLIHRSLGSRDQIYSPTFIDDIEVVTQPIVPRSEFIATYDQDLEDFYQTVETFRRIQIVQTDETVSHHLVTNVIDNLDGTATVQLSPNIPGTEDISQVSLLERGRFGSDVFEFNIYDNKTIIEATLKTTQR